MSKLYSGAEIVFKCLEDQEVEIWRSDFFEDPEGGICQVERDH